jgi:hypothetical protein
MLHRRTVGVATLSPQASALIRLLFALVWECFMRRVAFVLAALFLSYLAPPSSVAVSKSPCVRTGASCIAVNLAVTAETIATTICIRGRIKDNRLRPGSAFIRDMKLKLGSAAGLSPEASLSMTLDHIIPLELGGHPSAESNLQLQDVGEARLKDNAEMLLNALVCSGFAPLDDARAAIARNWRTAEQQFEVPVTKGLRGREVTSD